MKTQRNYLNRSFKIFTLLALFLMVITSCKKDDLPLSDGEYRVLAWKHLSTAQQATVNIKWQEAPVEKKMDKNQEVVFVTFSTTQDAHLGPIQVFIDVKTKMVIGVGGRF